MSVLIRLDEFPEHLAMIGLIATDWSSLEGTLALLFWDLVGDPDKGSAIYYSLGSATARFDVMRALANRLSNQAMKEELNRVFKKIRGLAGTRNFVVHGQWGLEKPGEIAGKLFVQVETPANSKTYESRLYSVSDLRKIADDIRAVEGEVWLLHELLPYNDQPPTHWKLAHLNELRAKSKTLAELMERIFPGLPSEIVFDPPKYPPGCE